MAQLPQFKGLTLEQVPGDLRDKLEPLVRQLNPFMLGVAGALNKGVSFKDNFAAQVQTFDVSVPDDWVYVQPSGAAGAQAAFLNGWTNFNNSSFAQVSFRKTVAGEIEGRGLAQYSATAATVYVLPTAYRVAANQQEVIPSVANTAAAGIQVLDTGAVQYVFGSTVSYLSTKFRLTAADRTPVVPSCFPYTYASTLAGPCQGAWIARAYAVDPNNKALPDLSFYMPPISLDWTETAKDGKRTMKIRNIPGLPPSRTYRITVVSSTW